MKTVLIAANTSWYIYNFRGNLISELLRNGYRVVAAAPVDSYSPRLAALGAEYFPLEMDNKGRNPFRDLILLARFCWLFVREKPACYLGFTIKPNIYGSLAAILLGVPTINNIAGLGSVFGSKGPTQFLVRQMYRIALGRAGRVFFQNQEDQSFFINLGIVDQSSSELLPGSGVDTNHFAPPVTPVVNKDFTFLLLGRLLREKGVPEYVEAARTIKARRPSTRFQLLGFVGVNNPSAISMAEVQEWVQEGAVEYLGATDDVRVHIARADCVVLPSYYREGVPRAILEASSMGKPVIATDIPGARDAVLDGQSGLLVKPRNSHQFLKALVDMLELPAPIREHMGRTGRHHMQANFDERKVLSRYVTVIADLATD